MKLAYIYYQAKQRLKHGKRDKAVTYCDLQHVKLRWQLNILLNLNKSLQNKNQQIILILYNVSLIASLPP